MGDGEVEEVQSLVEDTYGPLVRRRTDMDVREAHGVIGIT